MEFLQTIIQEKLDINEVIDIERAHRIGPLTGRNERPRSIIVHFQNYTMKQMVLQAAWSKKDICVKDCRIYFEEDFTTRVFKEPAKNTDK